MSLCARFYHESGLTAGLKLRTILRMKRLLVFTAVVVLLLASVPALARLRALPLPHSFLLQALNRSGTADCRLPCWHQITPGTSSRIEAEGLMDADPDYGRIGVSISSTDTPRLLYRWMATVTEDNSARIFYADDQRISDIELVGALSPAQALLGWGSPESYRFGCGGEFEFHYGRMQVVFFGQERLARFQDLDQVRDTAIVLNSEVLTADSVGAPWTGFNTRFRQDSGVCP
jgi:hypothetical protein